MAVEPNPQVKSADRVLDVFELLARSGRGVSHSSIADRLGIPKSSLTPLLRNMVRRGYVVAGLDGRTYQLGPQLLKLVGIGSLGDKLEKLAVIFLNQATREVEETSAFNQLKDDEQQVIATVAGPHRLTTHMKVGDLAPLYATSGGKAILAAMLDEDREDYFGRVPLLSHTEATVVRRDILDSQILEIQKTGIAYSFEEWTVGIIGIGAALPGPDGIPLGSVNFAIPAARFSDDLRQRAERALKKCVADMCQL